MKFSTTSKSRLGCRALALALGMGGATGAAHADPAVSLSPAMSPAQSVRADTTASYAAQDGAVANESGISGFVDRWLRQVTVAQSEQPSWPALLNTPPPYLVQQVRYDQYIEHVGNDASVRNFGVNKGIQLIPTMTEEVDVALPPYLERDNRTPARGFGDWQFALFKQRLLSAGPKDGNYVVSAWVAGTAPTGSSKFTNHVYFVSPNIGGGKGIGDFDVQATFGASIPTSRSHTYGNALIGNLGVQYRFEKLIWPEVELNWTDWLNGKQHGGKDQLFMTVGAVLGKFKIHNRLGVALGIGYQFPLEPSYSAKPTVLPTYSRNWVASLRMPF